MFKYVSLVTCVCWWAWVRHSGLLGNYVCVQNVCMIKSLVPNKTDLQNNDAAPSLCADDWKEERNFSSDRSRNTSVWTEHVRHTFIPELKCFNRFFFWSTRLYFSCFTFWMSFCAAGLISHQHARIWSVKTTEGDKTDGAESLCSENSPPSGQGQPNTQLHFYI